MITLIVVTCVVFMCALLYMGLSIVWWLLVAVAKLALFLVGALLTVGGWIIAPVVIVGLLVFKLTLFAVVVAVAGTVLFAVGLAFRDRRRDDMPVGAMRSRRFDMDDYLSRMERRLRNLETIGLRHARRY
jgi:hypothetical protein